MQWWCGGDGVEEMVCGLTGRIAYVESFFVLMCHNRNMFTYLFGIISFLQVPIIYNSLKKINQLNFIGYMLFFHWNICVHTIWALVISIVVYNTKWAEHTPGRNHSFWQVNFCIIFFSFFLVRFFLFLLLVQCEMLGDVCRNPLYRNTSQTLQFILNEWHTAKKPKTPEEKVNELRHPFG